MPDKQMTESEVKLIRLVDKLDAMKDRCDELTNKMDKNMAWKKDLELIDKDIVALQRDIKGVQVSIDHDFELLEGKFEKLNDQSTWLMRALFGSMLSAGLGLVVFLIQKG